MLLNTLRYGYTISLKDELTVVPPGPRWATNLDLESMPIVREKVAQLVLKGAIEEVPWL